MRLIFFCTLVFLDGRSIVPEANGSARLQVDFEVQAYGHQPGEEPTHNAVLASLSQGLSYGLVGQYRVIANSLRAFGMFHLEV